MNEKITFPRLASMLADQSGRSKRFSEDFLREFFATISGELEKGESIRVKGLGTFRLSRVEPRRSVDVTTGQPMEISGHAKVVFTPSKELAEAVNSPFEAFSTIEIADHVDLSEIFSMEEISIPQLTDELSSVNDPENETGATTLSEGNSASNAINGLSPVEEDIHEREEECFESQTQVNAETLDTVTEDDMEEERITLATTLEENATSEDSGMPETALSLQHRTRKTLWISLAAVIAALISITAVWYVLANDDFQQFFGRLNRNGVVDNKYAISGKEALNPPATSVDVATETAAPADHDSATSIDESEVPTTPSDAVVYDTIGTSRFLTTMARAHYGNFNFWPYIYEENKSFLGHPDRIRPGTPVVIPKLSKYSVNPNNAADVEKAKRLGMEIYARYGKKI